MILHVYALVSLLASQFNDYLKGILVDNDHNNSETEKVRNTKAG